MGRAPSIAAKRNVTAPPGPSPIPRAAVPPLPWDIHVRADWEHLPMPEAQTAYAKLKFEFEKAGSILNARSSGNHQQWSCFMADKKIPSGDPKIPPRPSDCPSQGQVLSRLPSFIDNAHKNSKTGLIEVVRICSEICSIRYNQIQIDERREREAPKRGE